MTRMWELATEPMAWSFVRLYGRNLEQDVREYDGLPGSHAWRWTDAARQHHARLITKAQVMGVLVSIQTRVERVEFLVDDGTALVKAVLWGSAPSPLASDLVLGDLVHVEGKLNMDLFADNAALPRRELRVVRITKVEDPNEELLHWMQVQSLIQEVYSNGLPASHSSSGNGKSDSTNSSQSLNSETDWDAIVADVFFRLAIDPATKERFLRRSGCEKHDELMINTLEALLLQQHEAKTGTITASAIRVTFVDHLAAISSIDEDQQTKREQIRSLRKTFAVLRSAGLLFLEDMDTDRHLLVTFEFALKPAIVQALADRESGASMVELAECVFTQDKLRRLPLGWLQIALWMLLEANMIAQKEDSTVFYLL